MPQRSVATNYTFEQQRSEINLLAADFWSQKTNVDNASSTYLKHDGSNDFTGGTLNVPDAFTISSNSGAGTLTISGNLNVTGTTTTVNTTNLDVTDKNITIAKGNNADATADGAGITIDSGTDITWNFVNAKDAWVSSIGVEATSFLKGPYGQFTGSGTPTTGYGVEVNAPDENTGQIISYHRGNSAYKELRIKGSSVGLYTGTSNAIVGTFNSTGLTMESGKNITCPGDLDVDGTSYFGANGSITSGANFVLSSNKFRVTGSDTVGLEVQRAGNATIQCTDTTNSTDLQLRANSDGGLVRTATDKPLIFGTFQQERLRIDSSGHIHTGYTTDVTGADQVNILSADGGGVSVAQNNAGNATSGTTIGSYSFQGYHQGGATFASAEARISAIAAANHTGSSAATDLAFYTKPSTTGPGSAPTERLRIDSSGNIGQAVTPSAWSSAQANDFFAYQVGSGTALFGRGSGDEDRGGISANLYSTASDWKYIANGNAGRIYFEDGSIVFNTCDSGTAGATATLNERLKIDVNGNTTFTGTGGNVHTFTSDSYHVLDIVADSNNDEGNSDNIIRFRHGSGGSLSERAEIRYDESDGWLELSAGDNQNHLVIKSDGFVGVGVNPTAKFHVSSAYNEMPVKISGGAHNGYSSPLQVTASNGDMRLEVSADNGVQFTRGPVGGAEHVSNTPDMWQKIGIWKGANVDGAARCKITVMGTDTHDSNGNVAGETIIYLAFGANHVLKGYYYSTTGQYPGLAGVAWNYDNNDSSNKKVEIWVKYDSAYGMTQCYADCSTGLFEGSNINTGLTSVPAGAQEIESYFTIRTSNGTSSNERLRIQPNGQVCIGTNNHHDRDFVVNTGGNSAVYFGMTGTNSTQPWVNSTRPILSVGTDGTGWPNDGSTHSNKLVNFGIGGGAAGTSANIEHSHFAITLNGTILSQHGVQTGGNATGGYKFNSQYSGKGYDIATQYATAANGGSNGVDPMFSGWWGSTNTFRVNTNGQVKFGNYLNGAVQSGNFSIGHSGTTKTVRISGLVSGSVMFHWGTYSSAGQGQAGKCLVISGYQTANHCFDVVELQSWDGNTMSLSGVSKNGSNCEFTITNNHGSYTAGSNWHLWGNDEVTVTII